MQDSEKCVFKRVEEKTKRYNIMKNRVLAFISATLAVVASASCTKNDYPSYDEIVPNAVVTVKPEGEGNGFYLQLDDNTIIKPVNNPRLPFELKETRAFINYKVVSEEKGVQMGHVNWITELYTKQTVESKGKDEDKAEYGSDPVELVNAFPTVCEDGYLTLRFRTLWGRFSNVKHKVNLVTGVDESDPYLVEFRHDKCGDVNEVVSDGYVAFRLDKLPDTEDKTVKLRVRFTASSGETKIATFDYKTRK